MALENEFHGPNLGYILELHQRYRDDPNSVDEATRKLFEQWSPAAVGPALHPHRSPLPIPGAVNLAWAIRSYGYLSAQLDPLDPLD